MTDLLNLPGLQVLKVIETESQYTVLVAVVPSRPEPCCLLQPVSLRRNGTKRQFFRDMPMHGRFVDIQVDRQRFNCKACGTTVYERVPHIDGAHRMTERMALHIAKAAVKRTFSEVGREVGLTEGTVRNVFRAYVDDRLKRRDAVTPTVLGIDEKFLLGKPRAVLGNVKERTLLDILPTRFRTDIGPWLDSLPGRDGIEVVCQDMRHEYRTIARKHLPKAVLVVDKFHVIMKANLAVEKFRQKMNASLPTAERVKLKNQRKILLARNHTIHDRTREKLDRWLHDYPQLADVYWMKERFYDVYDVAGREEAETRLIRWRGLIPSEYEPFFKELLSSLKNWHDGIFAYFEHPYTNAYVEGVNRLLDDLQRAGRGYSFDVIRAKALLAYGRQKVGYPQFIRDELADNYTVWWSDARPETVNYGTDIDLLQHAFGRVYRSRWDGSGYTTEELPSGISTLEVGGLETADEPISTQLYE